MNTIFKNLSISITIPDSKAPTTTPTNEVIPVFHFNQQTVPNGWGEYICGPTSTLIGVSAFDLVNFSNFQAKVIGLATAMGSHKSSAGTHPNNMAPGFNKYFTTLNMETQPFTEANIKTNIQNGRPMVINLLTDSNLGYKGNFGHYVACTGYKNGQIGINDPHGFSLGRGYRYWYNFSTIKRAVDNNGSRPLWTIRRK